MRKTVILTSLILCGLLAWRGTAASGVPGASADDVVRLVERFSGGSFREESGREWRMQAQREIERRIEDAFSPDDAKARAARSELDVIGQAIKNACERHKEASQTVEDAIALMYLGPIAMRAYLDMAKQHRLTELGGDYFWFLLGYVMKQSMGDPTRDMRRALAEYLKTREAKWDDRFLEHCSLAVRNAMAGYERLLAADPCATPVVYRHPEALLLTLEGIREISSVVDGNKDLSALQYALICPRPHGRNIGTASGNPMVALARVVTDPNLAAEPRRAAAASEAVGAVASAYGVFFRAARSLPDALETDLTESGSAVSIFAASTIKPLTPVGAKIFLQNMKRPKRHAGAQFTLPSQVTSQFVTLLKSPDGDTQCSAAKTLGLIVPTAADFVDLMAKMLIRTGADLDAGASRDVFSLASSSFEAIFALANAATANDPDVQRNAENSLRRIFGASASPSNQISDVVGELITLLRTNEHYVVENEVFNALFAIPSATRETVARMEDGERNGASPKARACAEWSKDRLRELARAAASSIRRGLVTTTDLYRARRYLLILRLYGEALPDRPVRYFNLLAAHATPSAETGLAVKRLVAQEVLYAFQSTNGTGREVKRDTLDKWMRAVNNWANQWTQGSTDSIMQQYLDSIGGEIKRLEHEGYGFFHRRWQWFYQLSLWGEISVVVLLAVGCVVLLVGILWLAVPAQLTDWALEDPMREGFPLFPKRMTDILVLSRWLGATDRALDAWIARHRGRLLSQTFRLGGESPPLGEDRPDRIKSLIDHYVDLGNHRDIDTFCDAIRKGAPLAVWIKGEGGGSGKTTLACYMAHVALGQEGRPVIPVVINVDWGQSLMDCVRRLCHINGRLLSPTMIRNLAGRGRIILIVDGLSETRGTLDGEAAAFRYVVVTSRDGPPEDHRCSIVRVGSLTIQDVRRLHAFVRAYTRKKESRERALMLIQRLADAAGHIRPVFAWLAVAYAEERRDPIVDKDQYSLLDLITTCVGRQQPRGPHALNETSYYRAAELVAYAVVHCGWAPRMILRETAQSRLLEEGEKLPFRSSSNDEIKGDVALGQLEQCGLLNRGSIKQSSLVAKQFCLSFAHDVVAEFLAALYVSKWPEIPFSTREEIRQSGGDFAEVLGTVIRERGG